MKSSEVAEMSAMVVKVGLFSLAVLAGVGMLAGGMTVLGTGAILAGCTLLTVGDND